MAWITLGENNPVHSMVDVFKVTLGKMIKIHLLEYFCYFASLPLETDMALHCTNLYSFQPGIFHITCDWNWTNGSGGKVNNSKRLQTDGLQTIGDQNSLLELSVQVFKDFKKNVQSFTSFLISESHKLLHTKLSLDLDLTQNLPSTVSTRFLMTSPTLS